MITIKNGDDRLVRLKVWKGKYKLEDFKRALMKVWLLNDADALPVAVTLDECGVPTFRMPMHLELGTYGVKVVWIKNQRAPKGLLDSRCCMMAESDCFVCVSNYEDECTHIEDDYVLTVEMTSQSYGYDGLSAYELAVLLELTTLSQKDWVANLAEMNAREREIALAELQRVAEFNDIKLEHSKALKEMADTVKKAEAAADSIKESLGRVDEATRNADKARDDAHGAADDARAAQKEVEDYLKSGEYLGEVEMRIDERGHLIVGESIETWSIDERGHLIVRAGFRG